MYVYYKIDNADKINRLMDSIWMNYNKDVDHCTDYEI